MCRLLQWLLFAVQSKVSLSMRSSARSLVQPLPDRLGACADFKYYGAVRVLTVLRTDLYL
jgi:hypothetical protein